MAGKDLSGVYVRAFVRNVEAKRRKMFGNPPFAVKRVRLSGLVVEMQEEPEAVWLWVDDATGVARVQCTGSARSRALAFAKGSSVEVYGSLDDADDLVVADSVRDNSSEPYADVLGLLETMEAYQSYFGIVPGPIEPGSFADLSPIRPKRAPDATTVLELITHAGISLPALAAKASGGDEQALLPVLHNLMESGLCYANKEMYFPL
jgi:hypothetical protein